MTNRTIKILFFLAFGSIIFFLIHLTFPEKPLPPLDFEELEELVEREINEFNKRH